MTHAIPPRRGRALYLPRVKAYRIPSESKPGHSYTVWLGEKPSDFSCDCEDFGFERSSEVQRTGKCKHIVKALALRKAGQ